MPVASQTRTPLPEHCVVPGVHWPVQTPATHAELLHVCAVDHVPVTSQVWTALPEQRTAAGVQDPVHAPSTHA
jgi:hypothetical protein